jgi:hypothetical protein
MKPVPYSLFPVPYPYHNPYSANLHKSMSVIITVMKSRPRPLEFFP